MSQLLLLCKHIQTRTRRNESLAYIEYCFPIKVGFLYHYNFQLMSITEGCSSSSFDAVMKHTCIIMPFCFFLPYFTFVFVCAYVCLRRWWRFPRCLPCTVFSFVVRASNEIIFQQANVHMPVNICLKIASDEKSKTLRPGIHREVVFNQWISKL